MQNVKKMFYTDKCKIIAYHNTSTIVPKVKNFLKEQYHEQNKVTGEEKGKDTCHYLKVLRD